MPASSLLLLRIRQCRCAADLDHHQMLVLLTASCVNPQPVPSILPGDTLSRSHFPLAGEQPWSAAHTPHGGSTIGHSGAHGSLAGMSNPSMSGARPSVMGGAGSMSGLGAASLLSRRPSYQVGHAELGSSPSRQSSIMSMVRASSFICAFVHPAGHVSHCKLQPRAAPYAHCICDVVSELAGQWTPAQVARSISALHTHIHRR
jgi:hypothetical protein